MSNLILLLVASALGSAISHRTKLPSIPFFMLVGALLSLGAEFVPFRRDESVLQDAIVLGATFLVFAAGLRMNPGVVKGHRAAALKVAAVQFLVLGTAGFLLARAMDYSFYVALYLAVALAASSTLVSMGVLAARHQLSEPFGRLTTGVLLIQDMLAIILISLIPHLSQGPGGLLTAALKLAILITISALVMSYASKPLVTRWVRSDEVLLLTVLAILFAFMAMAYWMGLPAMGGAFLGGLALSTFPSNLLVRGQLKSLEDFFSAAFFTALGADLAYLPIQVLPPAILMTAVVLLVTPLVVTWVGTRVGMTARASLESGLVLSQTSEFSLVAVLVGMNSGFLSREVFSLVAVVTLLTMLTTPIISTDATTWRILKFFIGRFPVAECPPMSDHVVLLGAGKAGQRILERLDEQGCRTVVIDSDPVVVSSLSKKGVLVLRGDGVDPRLLRAAHVNKAKVVLSTLPRPIENERLLRELEGPLVIVRHDSPETAERVRKLGGRAVSYTEQAAAQVLEWLLRGSRDRGDDLEVEIDPAQGRGVPKGMNKDAGGDRVGSQSDRTRDHSEDE